MWLSEYCQRGWCETAFLLKNLSAFSPVWMQSYHKDLTSRSLLLSAKQDYWVMPVLLTGPLVCLQSPLQRQLSSFQQKLPLGWQAVLPRLMPFWGLALGEAEWMVFSESWLQEEGRDCHFYGSFFILGSWFGKLKVGRSHLFPLLPTTLFVLSVAPKDLVSPSWSFPMFPPDSEEGGETPVSICSSQRDTGETPLTVPHSLCMWHEI